MKQGQFFKRNLTGLDSELSFKTDRHNKVKESSLSNNFPKTGGRIVGLKNNWIHTFVGRIIGFIPFPRALALCEKRCPWCSRYRRRKWTRRH